MRDIPRRPHINSHSLRLSANGASWRLSSAALLASLAQKVGDTLRLFLRDKVLGRHLAAAKLFPSLIFVPQRSACVMKRSSPEICRTDLRHLMPVLLNLMPLLRSNTQAWSQGSQLPSNLETALFEMVKSWFADMLLILC